MRFISFLTEMPGDPGENHIQKRERANRQRARNGTRKRAAMNKQAMQAKGDVINMGNQGQGFKGARPANRIAGAEKEQKKQQIKTLAQVDPAMKPFLASAQGDRAKAIEMITLLGAIYQTKRTNPQAQLSVPKLVTQSQNKEELQKLFDIARDKDLGQLAAMSQEIKRNAATPGTAPGQTPAAGTSNVPQTPGQTPAGKTMLQKLLNTIKAATKNLSRVDFQIARKKLDQAAQNAKPNPLPNQQPQTKPVVTQG